jgi:hypothetical protein
VNAYRILAGVTLTLHLAWLAWVLCGWLVTRNRPLLRWLHIASLLYGIVISAAGWVCPLTYAEQWFESRAGLVTYQRSFVEHYLEALVYPDVPPALLMWSAVVVCAGILGIYVARFRQRRAHGGW